MSELIAYRSERQRLDDTASLGVMVFLAGWAMLHAGLLFAILTLRIRSQPWLSAGSAQPGMGLPAAGVVVLLAGSAAMQLGVWRIERGRPLELSAALILALLFGLLFVGLQVALWRHLESAGSRTSGHGSGLWVVVALLTLEAAVAAGASGALLSRSLEGRYSAARHLGVRLWTLYWHFLAAMNLLAFAVTLAE